jgi:class 3 adenylate cyclase/tetratricopeptide (TPR) repeat protein
MVRPCACGNKNPAGSLFCTDCGKPLVEKKQTASLVQSEGERRVVTVLFADVSGFTAMSEKLDPEEVTAIMNSFFKVLSDQIYKYGGTVDKYIGDCIMALFGAPLAHEDDAERAVAAAWEMQVQGGVYADDLEKRTGIRLKIRIGLNTGLVVAGAVGGDQKRDYTVLGDTVNLASRLESNARPGHILVSKETQRLARRAWFFEALEPIKVKGKEALISVFEVAGHRSGLAEGEERPAFTGRAAEMAALKQELARAVAGHPAILALVGDAGIGKSRLTREFLRVAAAEGCRVLRGRCLSYQSTTPYALVSRLLAEGFGFDGDPGDLPRLEALCASHGLSQARLAAEGLSHVLGSPIADSELTALTPDQLRSFVNRTLIDLLRAEARTAPIVLALNDIHWIDSASGDFVSTLIADLKREPAPVLTLLLYRPEGEDKLEFPEMDYRRLRLGPLSAEEGFNIIGSFLEGTADGPAAVFLRDAVAKAEGNPFYLCELIRSLTEQEVLVREGDAWVLRESDAANLIPATIHGAVSARVDRLSVGARQVVQIGAVFGRSFSKRLVSRLLKTSSIDAEISEILAAELIYMREADVCTFSQAIIQEAVYQGQLVKTRKEIHRLVGSVLEEDATDAAILAPVLANHFMASDADVKAIKYLCVAANRDAERYANREAREALITALEVLDRLDPGERVKAAALGFQIPARSKLLLDLALSEIALGHYDAALANLDEAQGNVPAVQPGHPDAALIPAIHRAKGDVFMQRGQYKDAVEQFGLGLCASPDGAERARQLVLLGIVAFRQGDYAQALSWSAEAETLIGQGGHPREVGRAQNLAGLCLWRTGDITGADAQFRKALPLREQARDFIGVGDTLFNLASLATGLGRYEEAVSIGQKALELHRRLGDPQRTAQACCNVGIYEMYAGDLDAGAAHLGEAVETARRIGDRFNEGLAILNLGEIALKRGDRDETVRRVREALPILEELQSKGNVAQGLLILGEALEGQPGSETEAWEALQKGLQLAEDAGEKMVVGMAYYRISRFYRQAGRPDEAMAWAGKGVAILQDTGFRLELGRAYAELAAVLDAQGKADLAKGTRDKAIALFEELGSAKEAEKVRTAGTPARAG